MYTLILLTALGGQINRVDYIELNYMYNENDRSQCFTQYIFWKFSTTQREYIAIDWSIDIQPISYYEQMYRLSCSKQDKKYKIVAPYFIITHTFYDPERRNLKLFPLEKRGLK